MLLVQFKKENGERRVGLLEQDTIRELEGVTTTYALAQEAIRGKTGLAQLAQSKAGAQTHAYADVLASGRLLTPLDHEDSAHTYVCGTGLTHLGSADTRDAMACAPPVFADRMCWPVSLIATFSSWAAV